MRTRPSQTAPDRHGNTYFSDVEQIAFFDQLLAHDGFSGTDHERGLVAEAWWMGDWSPNGRCPSLEEATAFCTQPLAGGRRPTCPVHGEEHVFAFVKSYPDETDLWRCRCGAEACNAREAGLRIDEDDESEWEGHRLPAPEPLHIGDVAAEFCADD